MTKQDLENKLNQLREKWRGKVPKTNDPLWWKFRCDKSIAIGIKARLDRWSDPVQVENSGAPVDDLFEVAKEIFQ